MVLTNRIDKQFLVILMVYLSSAVNLPHTPHLVCSKGLIVYRYESQSVYGNSFQVARQRPIVRPPIGNQSCLQPSSTHQTPYAWLEKEITISFDFVILMGQLVYGFVHQMDSSNWNLIHTAWNIHANALNIMVFNYSPAKHSFRLMYANIKCVLCVLCISM